MFQGYVGKLLDPRHVAVLEFCSDALKTSFVFKGTKLGEELFQSFRVSVNFFQTLLNLSINWGFIHKNHTFHNYVVEPTRLKNMLVNCQIGS